MRSLSRFEETRLMRLVAPLLSRYRALSSTQKIQAILIVLVPLSGLGLSLSLAIGSNVFFELFALTGLGSLTFIIGITLWNEDY
jgi:hypothetical protein